MIEKIIIPVEYSDFADVFLKKSNAELPKRSEINKHTINLDTGKQPSYRSIYSLEPVEFETLKTYIKTNLTNGFICLSKSLIGTLILFVQKPDSSLYLYINY